MSAAIATDSGEVRVVESKARSILKIDLAGVEEIPATMATCSGAESSAAVVNNSAEACR